MIPRATALRGNRRAACLRAGAGSGRSQRRRRKPGPALPGSCGGPGKPCGSPPPACRKSLRKGRARCRDDATGHSAAVSGRRRRRRAVPRWRARGRSRKPDLVRPEHVGERRCRTAPAGVQPIRVGLTAFRDGRRRERPDRRAPPAARRRSGQGAAAFRRGLMRSCRGHWQSTRPGRSDPCAPRPWRRFPVRPRLPGRMSGNGRKGGSRGPSPGVGPGLRIDVHPASGAAATRSRRLLPGPGHGLQHLGRRSNVGDAGRRAMRIRRAGCTESGNGCALT